MTKSFNYLISIIEQTTKHDKHRFLFDPFQELFKFHFNVNVCFMK